MSWYKKCQYDLPDWFDSKAVGSCMLAAELLTQQLLSKGIKDFQVVEGWVTMDQTDPQSHPYQRVKGEKPRAQMEHTWIEYNGEKIDQTAQQFEWWGFDPSTIQYVKIKKRYSPEEYLQLCGEFPIPEEEKQKFRKSV
jgi:hypothetical protein